MPCRLADTGGMRRWSGGQDEEGYRSYVIKYRVECDSDQDGPAQAMQTPGLPTEGAMYLIAGDEDVWAYCTGAMQVEPATEGAQNKFFDVSCNFTTKSRSRLCRESRVEDPLLEPQKISGGFVREREERTTNVDGTPIQTSAKEQIHGASVEFDKSRNTVHIEQNVLALELDVLTQFNDTVNDAPLWGLPARCWKLTVGPWEVKYYGSCYKYYTRTFDFEANVKYDPTTGSYVSGWDRTVLDEGTKVLRGDWDRDPASLTYGQWRVASGVTGDNPGDFMKFHDWNGNPSTVVLDGTGRPIHEATGTSTATQPGEIDVIGYLSANFLYLGIPVVF